MKTSLIFNVQHCYVINFNLYVMNTEMWMITLVGIKFIAHLVYCSPLPPIQGLNNNFFYSPPMKHIYRFWLVLLFFLFNPDTPRLNELLLFYIRDKKEANKKFNVEKNIIELQAMHSNRKLLTQGGQQHQTK